MENLYAPPTAEMDAPLRSLDVGSLSEWDDAALNKLYYRSCNVRVIGWLLLLFSIFWAFSVLGLGLQGAVVETYVAAIAIAMIAYSLLTSIAVILRTSWARILGIFPCLFMLLSVPVGTIIGIAGLFAFINAKELFGPDRIAHAELKREYKVRKLSRKWQRLQERRSA